MSEWKPIDTHPDGSPWDAPLILVRDENGNEAKARFEFEDESWDEESGEESVWSAWHDEQGALLTFSPTHWKPLPSESDRVA